MSELEITYNSFQTEIDLEFATALPGLKTHYYMISALMMRATEKLMAEPSSYRNLMSKDFTLLNIVFELTRSIATNMADMLHDETEIRAIDHWKDGEYRGLARKCLELYDELQVLIEEVVAILDLDTEWKELPALEYETFEAWLKDVRSFGDAMVIDARLMNLMLETFEEEEGEKEDKKK